MQTQPSQQANRLLFLDLFRGLAVFGMFDAHITNALVRLPVPLSGLAYYHDKLFNLPAEAFLMAAGISFGMSVARRWQEYRAWSPALRNRLGRLLEILALGFLLHVPYFSLRRTMFQASHAQILKFLSMDVLQCIAATAFVALALVWVLPGPRWFFHSCVIATVVIALATPAVWNLSQHLPWWLGTYLSKRWGSTFPLFPYAAYLFAGAAWGYRFASAAQAGMLERFMKSSGKAGRGMVLAGAALAFLPVPAPYNDFWIASPQFFLVSVGFLNWTLSVLSLAKSWLALPAKFLAPLGQESLLIYMAHLMIIYGSLINRKANLRTMIGPTIGFWEWLVIYALLALAMVALARLWSWVKEKSHWNISRLEWAVAACLAVVFIVR